MTLTPAEFNARIAQLGVADSVDKTSIIKHVEALLDDRPEDPDLRALLATAFDLAQASDTLDVAPYGLHREKLIGWDRWSTTWLGHNTATGQVGHLRILRPNCRTHPTALRVLERDARRLFPVLPNLQTHPDALSACLAVTQATESHRAPFVSLIVEHSRWTEHNLGWPRDLTHTVHRGPNGLAILCLTPEPPRTTSSAWDELTQWLSAAYDLENADGYEPLLQALMSLRGGRPDETLKGAMKHDLVRQWHALRERRKASHARDRSGRLRDLLERLHVASTPPAGRAAVGVTPDGHLTIVESDGQTLSWGTDDDPLVIVRAGQPLDPTASRRLLRARAMAIPAEHLQTQAMGDPQYLDRVTQWVATALKLRTLRLLLQHRDRG